MGVSTNGQIHYGIVFEEDHEFPWSECDDIDEWWREVLGYKPPFELYDESGKYLPGVTCNDPRFNEYFAHKRQWIAANPIPVEEVNYCSGECPMYMLAVPGVGLTARRGYPEQFEPDSLKVDPDAVAKFREFCERYGIDISGEMGWYLSSYWG